MSRPTLRLGRGVASSPFGSCPGCLCRLQVAVAGEGGEAGGSKGRLVDRRFTDVLEVAEEPAGRNPRMSARILAGDQQRQLERVCEAKPREFLGCRLRDEQVPVLERSPEDGARMALRSRRSSSPGPRRLAEFIRESRDAEDA
jgi:hypothetical protein